jgi:peptidoglycan hydrolase-like protein with peptidoglycan-binding domain
MIGRRSLVFVPAMAYLPLTDITVKVPAGPTGVRGANGAHLVKPVMDKFRIADGSTKRLQQLLSLLDYSPLSFTASGSPISRSDVPAQRAALFVPPAGGFRWRNHGWPHRLLSLWTVGSYGLMTKGLVMEFEADHGLTTDGLTSTALWQSLLETLATGHGNTGGYNYALGNQAEPESLTIWHDGTVAVHVAANTGIAQAPTANGNFNVFARFRNEVMRGTNPDGTKYADPVQFVAYFNGGDAVHYFPRASYGIPQSLGCIELDLADAAKAWPYLAYGTIVSVIN